MFAREKLVPAYRESGCTEEETEGKETQSPELHEKLFTVALERDEGTGFFNREITLEKLNIPAFNWNAAFFAGIEQEMPYLNLYSPPSPVKAEKLKNCPKDDRGIFMYPQTSAFEKFALIPLFPEI